MIKITKEEFLRRDPVKGTIIKYNPLNKTKLSKYEMDDIFLNYEVEELQDENRKNN